MNESNSIEAADLPPLPRSKGKKALLTCGCGCAGTLLIVAIVAVLLYRHFLGPGDQLPSDYITGEDTVLVVQVDGLNQDPGTLDLFVSVLEALMEMDPESLPEEEREAFSEFVESNESINFEDASEFITYMPNSMTLVVEDNGTELTAAFGLNLIAGSVLLKKIVTSVADDNDWSTHDWGDYEIIGLDPNSFDGEEEENELAFIGFQHDTFLIGNDLVTMQRILDRTAYEDEPGPKPESELRVDLEILRERWLLSCVLRDSPRLDLPGFFNDFWSQESDDISPVPVDLAWMDLDFNHVTIGSSIVGKDLTMRLEVNGLKEGDVDAVAQGLNGLGEHLADRFGEREVQLLFEVNQGTTSIAVNATLLELDNWFENELARPELFEDEPAESIETE